MAVASGAIGEGRSLPAAGLAQLPPGLSLSLIEALAVVSSRSLGGLRARRMSHPRPGAGGRRSCPSPLGWAERSMERPGVVGCPAAALVRPGRRSGRQGAILACWSPAGELLDRRRMPFRVGRASFVVRLQGIRGRRLPANGSCRVSSSPVLRAAPLAPSPGAAPLRSPHPRHSWAWMDRVRGSRADGVPSGARASERAQRAIRRGASGVASTDPSMAGSEPREDGGPDKACDGSARTPG
jgi:hypothetical protein